MCGTEVRSVLDGKKDINRIRGPILKYVVLRSVNNAKVSTPVEHPDPHQRIVAYILLVHLHLSYCDIHHGLHEVRDMHLLLHLQDEL